MAEEHSQEYAGATEQIWCGTFASRLNFPVLLAYWILFLGMYLLNKKKIIFTIILRWNQFRFYNSELSRMMI